jgi:uncharacterized membrane protein
VTTRARRWWSVTAFVTVSASTVMAASVSRRRAGPPYSVARAVVNRHCAGCHSEQPTVAAFPIAAGGLALDTAEQMQRHAGRIKERVVRQRNMPLLNKTEMTDEERALLGAWVESVAIGPHL